MVIINKLFKLYMHLACHSYSMSGGLTKRACQVAFLALCYIIFVVCLLVFAEDCLLIFIDGTKSKSGRLLFTSQISVGKRLLNP